MEKQSDAFINFGRTREKGFFFFFLKVLKTGLIV